MKFLAGYLLRSPMQAILATSVCAMLSLALPPLSYLSGAAVALVTLRLGPRHGSVVTGGATVAVMLLSLVVFRNPLPGPAYLLLVWLPVLALATYLRRTVSLERTLLLAAWFAGAMVAAVYVGIDDPAASWGKLFEDVLREVGQGSQSTGEMQDAFGMMTGAMAAGLTLGLFASLFIARWWQAMLFNVGGFQREFHALRFGRGFGLATAMTLGLALVGGTAIGEPAGNLLLVLLVLHMLHGVALVHGLAGKTGASTTWLVGMYALLVTPLLPAAVVTLAAIGFADEWFDFRAFFGNKGEEV